MSHAVGQKSMRSTESCSLLPSQRLEKHIELCTIFFFAFIGFKMSRFEKNTVLHIFTRWILSGVEFKPIVTQWSVPDTVRFVWVTSTFQQHKGCGHGHEIISWWSIWMITSRRSPRAHSHVLTLDVMSSWMTSRDHLANTHGLTGSQKEAFDAQRTADLEKRNSDTSVSRAESRKNETSRRKRKRNDQNNTFFIA